MYVDADPHACGYMQEPEEGDDPLDLKWQVVIRDATWVQWTWLSFSRRSAGGISLWATFPLPPMRYVEGFE